MAAFQSHRRKPQPSHGFHLRQQYTWNTFPDYQTHSHRPRISLNNGPLARLVLELIEDYKK